jgi:[ribosomal protein S5]-alanine N-acetyltransferase
VELVSARLVLRPAHVADLDFYFELRNRPEVISWTGVRGPRMRSDVERELRGWVGLWNERGFGTCTVFDRHADERLARVELDPVGSGWAKVAPGEIEIGCIVDPRRWNQGIAAEATLLVADDCFDRVGLHRLVAMTTTDNAPSLRALEKIGMSYVGETQHADGDRAYELFELRSDSRH